MALLRTAVLREGVTSLWRGLGVTLLRDVPFSAVYWACYEDLKVRLDHNTTRQQQHGEHMSVVMVSVYRTRDL